MTVRPFARQRPLVCCAVLFGAGIWLGIEGIIPLGILLGGLLLSVFGGALLHHFGKSALYACLAAVFFLGGIYVTVLNSVPLPEEGKYQITAYITGDVEVREDGFVQAYVRDLQAVDEQGNRVKLARAYWCMTADDGAETALAKMLFDGDRISFQGKLYVPDGRMNPYGFDFRSYLRQQNVRMAASGNTDLRLTKDASLDFAGVMYRLRTWIARRMDGIFGESAVYPKALLLGDKTELPDETRDTFADLGIAHVLAVSGLHVGLIASAMMFILRPLHLTPKQKTCVLALFLVLYAAMLDFAAPVVRAGILLLLTYGRRALRRSQDPLTFLSAAFLVILAAEPFSLPSLSFQMTFGAVAGMVLLGERFSAWFSSLPQWMQGREAAALFSATLGVIIPMTNAFHQLSLISVLINPAASFLMGLLLPAYAVITMIGCVYMPLGKALGDVLHLLLGWLPQAMEKLAALPFSVVRVPAMPWMLAAGLVIILILCTRYVALPLHRRLTAIAAVLAVSLGIWQLTMVRDVCYIQLYAGQADCALIADDGKTVVIDTGNNGRDLSSYLLSTGRNADVLILTHLHTDHTGGVQQLLEDGIRIDKVIIPEKAADQQVDAESLLTLEMLADAGIQIEEVSAGDYITLPAGRIDFVWPLYPRSGQDANHYSLASLIQIEGVRILTAGDLTGEYEMYASQQADILKVSHHGSAGSSSAALLDAVSPQLSIIPCAKGRVLPAEETLLRLEDAGTKVLRTDETGAVILRIRDGKYAVDRWLKNDQ